MFRALLGSDQWFVEAAVNLLRTDPDMVTSNDGLRISAVKFTASGVEVQLDGVFIGSISCARLHIDSQEIDSRSDGFVDGMCNLIEREVMAIEMGRGREIELLIDHHTKVTFC